MNDDVEKALRLWPYEVNQDLREYTEKVLALGCESAAPELTFWLIYSLEHDAWWRPAERGYTTEIQEAGRYTFADASKLCAHANRFCHAFPNEAMIPIVETVCSVEMNLQEKVT